MPTLLLRITSAALVLLLAYGLFEEGAAAQIVLRERVEVGAARPAGAPIMANTIFDGCGEEAARGFTVASDGILKVRMRGSFFPSYLATQRNDVPAFGIGVTTEQGLSYFFNASIYSVERFGVSYRYYLAPWGQQGPEYTLGVVTAGDEVVPFGEVVHGEGSLVVPAPCYPGPPPVLTEGDDVSISMFCCAGPTGGETFYVDNHSYVLVTEGVQGLVVQASPAEIAVGEVAVVAVAGLELDSTVTPLPAESRVDLALDQGDGTVGYLRHLGTSEEGLALSGVPATELQAGQVVVVAAELEPPALQRGGSGGGGTRSLSGPSGSAPLSGPAMLTVTARLSDDPAVTGSTVVTVLAASLSLEFAQHGAPVDPTTYVPERGDLLEVTARLTGGPPNASGNVTFRLTQAHEFAFADGTTGPKTVPLQNGAATVEVESLTWWGVATVQAAYTLGSEVLTAEQQIPVDSDGDTIADAWEMRQSNGGTLALGGHAQDGTWDDEISPRNSNNGDSFTKLAEYQGVTVGGAYQRLLPMTKEVFFDVRGASAGAFVVAEVERQVGLKVYEVDGVVGVSGGRLNIPAPGSGALEFVSPTTQFRGARGVVFVEDATVATPGSTNPSDITKNGLVIQNGNYIITGSSIPPSSYSISFGATNGTAAGSGGISRVYEGAISNVWNNNSIPEQDHTTFSYGSIVVSSGPARWTANYSNTDLNGDGDVSDPTNPFDLLSPSSTNDPVDGVVATLTEQQYLERVTLHEVGHALGMSLGNQHPTSGFSVMRSGPGPARASTFSTADIAQVKLK